MAKPGSNNDLNTGPTVRFGPSRLVRVLLCVGTVVFAAGALFMYAADINWGALIFTLFVLGFIVLATFSFRSFLEINEQRVRMRMFRTTAIEFNAITYLKYHRQGVTIRTKDKRVISFDRGFRDAGAAAEYVIRRLKHLNRLDEIELEGDVKRINKIAALEADADLEHPVTSAMTRVLLDGLFEALSS